MNERKRGKPQIGQFMKFRRLREKKITESMAKTVKNRVKQAIQKMQAVRDAQDLIKMYGLSDGRPKDVFFLRMHLTGGILKNLGAQSAFEKNCLDIFEKALDIETRVRKGEPRLFEDKGAYRLLSDCQSIVSDVEQLKKIRRGRVADAGEMKKLRGIMPSFEELVFTIQGIQDPAYEWKKLHSFVQLSFGISATALSRESMRARFAQAEINKIINFLKREGFFDKRGYP
jgi:hypothetical protein